jgi:hypothetical protein
VVAVLVALQLTVLVLAVVDFLLSETQPYGGLLLVQVVAVVVALIRTTKMLDLAVVVILLD